MMCRHLVRGLDFDKALSLAIVDRSSLFRRVVTVASDTDLSTGGFAPDAFVAGVYFVRSAQTFQEALHRSLEFAGAPNYCPVITGTLAGARWGRQAIAPEDIQHCPVLSEVERLTARLRETWKS